MSILRPKIIAVDFDGTIDNGRWDPDPENCFYKINNKAIDVLTRFQKSGGIVILWTCRSGRFLKDAVIECKKRGLTFDAINTNHTSVYEWADTFNSPKIFAEMYIDDRNQFPSGVDWKEIDKILNPSD